MEQDDFAKGARTSELFLDYICSQSYSGLHHLFQPNFEGLLPVEETAFRDEFLDFLTKLSPKAKQSAAYKSFQTIMTKKFNDSEIFKDDERRRTINAIQRQRNSNLQENSQKNATTLSPQDLKFVKYTPSLKNHGWGKKQKNSSNEE
jgi:hypothetical protein